MFESIRQGLQESIDFAEGKPVNAVGHDVSSPDVKAFREYVGMTLAEFASAFGISLGTLRHWERGETTRPGAGSAEHRCAGAESGAAGLVRRKEQLAAFSKPCLIIIRRTKHEV